MTAMKFKSRSNERIYCKEYFVSEDQNEKKVVMIMAYKKDEMDKKTKKLIEALGRYDYGF